MNQIGLRKRSNWKKLLYQNQPFPDNYVDESFLSQLKRNETVRPYKYWELVNDFSLILFHLTNLTLVILIFVSIYRFDWDSTYIVTSSSTISLIGYVLWELRLNSTNSKVLKIKSFTLVIFMFLLLSPVLKSLTRSTSSDSIWSISVILSIFNLMFHDYAINVHTPFYKPILSTNLSLSNALVLASRLNSTWQVFCFILFAIQSNTLLPLFDFSLRRYSPKLHYLLFTCLTLVVEYLMVHLTNLNAFLLWSSIQIFILLILPGYFLFLQRYKNELSGPWDIAKPIIRS
ncbi:phosphatidylinositol N-acetylglucosaminyltransferase Gpi2p subunit [[Candida] jaroonii]|uniref:Phosphatidylinositol N-acetylglucosaminyltransferase Gpi2p subunit n=1 Tax=[Candida] jaroonii TaxID=467808 RepID=A0ACA9YC67_9ASCO|nr:phosphatidylinositol N-acetylglucosaminyltransferase Gpi2p subunit [[Candida] jaroonii]